MDQRRDHHRHGCTAQPGRGHQPSAGKCVAAHHQQKHGHLYAKTLRRGNAIVEQRCDAGDPCRSNQPYEHVDMTGILGAEQDCQQPGAEETNRGKACQAEAAPRATSPKSDERKPARFPLAYSRAIRGMVEWPNASANVATTTVVYAMA